MVDFTDPEPVAEPDYVAPCRGDGLGRPPLGDLAVAGDCRWIILLGVRAFRHRRRSMGRLWPARVPGFGGLLGELIRKNLRQMICTLDFWWRWC